MKNEHKGYVLHMEHGEWVAYKSKNFKSMGLLRGSRVEDGKYPTDIERIVLGTSDLEQAKERLDARRKKQPKPKYDPTGQLRVE